MDITNLLDVALVKSRFTKQFEINGNLYLYHAILMDLLKLDPESLELFNRFNQGFTITEATQKFKESQGLLESLIKNHFLVGKSVDELRTIKDHVSRTRGGEGLSIIYVLPTDQCNFRCKYCFLEESVDEEYQFSCMSQDTARKGIDFFVRTSNPNSAERVMILYGGEPLMNPKVVKFAVNHLREKEPDIGINIVTNASLVDDEIARLFAEKDVSVGVSIDGPKQVHDKIRISCDGKGTFEHTKRGYLKLKEAGCNRIGISLTIGSHNVDHLREHVEYLFEEFSPTAFGFNFLVDMHKRKNPFSVPMDYATDKMIEAFKFLREKGVFEDRTMRRIKPFVKGVIHLKDCGAPGNQIVLAPNGDVGPCQAFLPSRKYFVQNVHRGELELTKDPSFQEWSKRYPLNIKECLDCEAIGICGGGCPYNSFVNTGSIWSLDERMCTHNKKVLKWILSEICN